MKKRKMWNPFATGAGKNKSPLENFFENFDINGPKMILAGAYGVDVNKCIHTPESATLNLDGKTISLNEFYENNSIPIMTSYQSNEPDIEEKYKEAERLAGIKSPYELKHYILQSTWHAMLHNNQGVGYNIVHVVRNPFPLAIKSYELIDDLEGAVKRMNKFVQRNNSLSHFMHPSEEHLRADVYFTPEFYEQAIIKKD